jgi:hypothetical protein
MASDVDAAEPHKPAHSCPCCGGRMIVIETFERGATPRGSSSQDIQDIQDIRIDTS